MKSQQIIIFDTTLRDGQQCPGAGMSFEKNIEYAQLAAKVGIDVLEAGFPAASQTDFMIVNTIAQEIPTETSGPIIAALCQLREKQIDITMEALKPALPYRKARLHVYLPVDPILMSALGDYSQQRETIINDVYKNIKKASAIGFEVELSLEGYSRMGENFDFVTEIIRAAISAGATVINCPDTIGGACKMQGSEYYVEKMKQHAAIIEKEFSQQNIIWSVHCHNDFGLALENTMNAVFFGPATQIEGCFNGVGERAGNVSLEQCIMYLKCFGSIGNGEKTFFAGANSEMLQTISDFISRYMLPRQPHWPITGDNSAKHTSGGHTNAIIKNPLAYQPFDPKDTGKEISFLFGPLSGGNHAQTIIKKYGYQCHENEKAVIAQYIKNYYSDRRKGITDKELLQAYLHYRKPIKVNKFNYAKNSDQCTVKIEGQFFDKKDMFEVSCLSNDSALAILHNAIKNHMTDINIEKFHSQSVNKGSDSISQSKIVLRNKEKDFTGIGEDQDIEISALKALVDAANQAYIHEHYIEEE